MKSNYGEVFRAMRERWGIRQCDAASEMGISSPTLSLRENGDRQFKTSELHKAYIKLGIDVGFGKVFDCIDSGNVENILLEMPQTIKEKVENKKYEEISIETLEMLKEALLDQVRPKTKMNLAINLERDQYTVEEKTKLNEILLRYQEKDGNILRAIKLLEIAMQ